MGRYIRRCGRVLLLLPVAVAIHVKKQMRGRGIEVVLCLGMLLIHILREIRSRTYNVRQIEIRCIQMQYQILE